MTEEVRPVQGDPATADHIADAADAHDASAISVLDTAANFTGTDVEAVLAELSDDIAAGGIPATIVDAKGDLIVATAADTVARRAVGANGTVLTADSAEGTGVKWAAPGGLSVLDLLNSTKTSADTPDAEFVGSISPFTAVDGTPGTATLLAGSGGIYDVTSRSKGLLVTVGTASGDSVELKQDYTLPDSECIVAPISFAADWAASLTNNEILMGIAVNDNDGGPFAGTAGQTAAIMFDTDTTGHRIIGWDGSAVIGVSFSTVGAQPPLAFFRIARDGTVYHLFTSLYPGHAWTYLGSKTMASAANNVWVFVQCAATMTNRITLGVPWFRQGVYPGHDPWPL